MGIAQRIKNLSDSLFPVPKDKERLVKYIDAASDALSLLGITPLLDSGTKSDVAKSLKFALEEMVQELEDMEDLAGKNGYLLPDAPFEELRNLKRNQFDNLTISQQDINAYYESVNDLVRVYSAWKQGRVNLTEKTKSLSQISSFDVSVDGYGSSGDPLSDIIGYESNADVYKRITTVRALSELDFSKRKPKVIFISDIGDRSSDGTVVCWKKMNDATSYTVKRRDVFHDVERTTTVRSTSLSPLAQEAVVDALSFYDDLSQDDTIIYEDKQVDNETLYAYSITAFQTKLPLNPKKVFDLPRSQIVLTADQINQIKEIAASDAESYGRDINSISPYPAISLVLYGDRKFAWVLAAANVRDRIEKEVSYRNVSYIGSSLTDLLSEYGNGALVSFNDSSKAVKQIEGMVATHGIANTLLAVMDFCGVTVFLSDKDDPAGYQSTEEALEAASGPLKKIISAIDAETATLDPSMIATNLSLVANPLQRGGLLLTAFTPKKSTLGILDIVGRDLIDLTTSEGVGKFLDVIRAFYDLSIVRS